MNSGREQSPSADLVAAVNKLRESHRDLIDAYRERGHKHAGYLITITGFALTTAALFANGVINSAGHPARAWVVAGFGCAAAFLFLRVELYMNDVMDRYSIRMVDCERRFVTVLSGIKSVDDRIAAVGVGGDLETFDTSSFRKWLWAKLIVVLALLLTLPHLG